MNNKMLELVYLGELGYEICSFIPWVRKISREYQKTKIYSFQNTEALYSDFAEWAWNGSTNRMLNFPYKKYRVDGEYFKYGIADNKYDILLHARGIKRKNDLNYKSWDKVVKLLNGYKIACIGTLLDKKIEGIDDLRGIELQDLMNYMAGSKMILGCSSGVIHLASHCGCNQVVWAYDSTKTYYGESLRTRYEKTWNPFNTKVEYIESNDWQPDPLEILKRVNKII